jgi:hypothetical protein
VAVLTVAIQSDRVANQVVLGVASGPIPNPAGQLDVLSLPAGFGDCLILEMSVLIDTEATQSINADAGAMAWLQDGNPGTLIEQIGSQFAIRGGTTRHHVQITPDSLVLWRSTEVLIVNVCSFDTNVTPTAIARYSIRVRRMRDQPFTGRTSPDEWRQQTDWPLL